MMGGSDFESLPLSSFRADVCRLARTQARPDNFEKLSYFNGLADEPSSAPIMLCAGHDHALASSSRRDRRSLRALSRRMYFSDDARRFFHRHSVRRHREHPVVHDHNDDQRWPIIAIGEPAANPRITAAISRRESRAANRQ